MNDRTPDTLRIHGRLRRVKETVPSPQPDLYRLQQAVEWVNQCLRLPEYRPDSVRLLREILKERADRFSMESALDRGLSG